MFEIFKNNSGTVLLTVAFLIVGVIFGMTAKTNDDGVFVNARYPDGTAIFSIGRNQLKIGNIDIATLDKEDVNLLISKLKNVEASTELGSGLRDLVKKNIGPFKPIPVEINLIFDDEQGVDGPVTKACRDTPVFGNSVVAYEILKPANMRISQNAIMSISVDREQLANCGSSQQGVVDVWVDKKYVERWVGVQNLEGRSISVRANVVAASF
jgi:hypothetical protein